MKCMCGYHERPDNIGKIRKHLDRCEKETLPKTKKGYLIVWRDGEFTVTDKKKRNETVFGRDIPVGVARKGPTTVALPTYTPLATMNAPKDSMRRPEDEIG